MSPRTREIRVGLVILTALAVLAVGIFLIGEKNNLFSRKNEYLVELNNVGGLRPGNPVQLNGVDVGTVERIVLPENPSATVIQVWITVDRQYAGRIRGPVDARAEIQGQPPSRARIKTLGLLGDKYIELTTGSEVYPAIPSGDRIPAAQPTNVDALLSSGEDVMDNVVEISSSLSKILGRMERGEGLLGELTSDSPSAQRLRESIIGTSESLERIALTVEQGEGPIPRLLNDRELAAKLERSLDRFDAVLIQAQSGPGLLPGLLNDPSTKVRFDETLASLQDVAGDLQAFTADLETSDALLPRLVKDEEYGREVTEEVRQFVERLNEVSAKLSEGEGTAARLINDPQIYEAVNDIIVGIHESRLLRWLIRNRQKAGIEKRYEDTRKAIEEQGGAAPPLDGGPEAAEPEPPAPEAAGPPPAPAEPPPAAAQPNGGI
jgi:phospholipid/cholesterol/gamma-HCH transport system substrate-binding protein